MEKITRALAYCYPVKWIDDAARGGRPMYTKIILRH